MSRSLSMPDPLSLRALEPLSGEDAAYLREDAGLRSASRRREVDLDAILDRLMLDPTARLATEVALAEFRLAELMDRLAERPIRFILIGGLVGRLYGSTLTTGDLDICHARDDANLGALAALLRHLGATFRRAPQYAPAELSAEVFATETDFVFCTAFGKFDLIGEFTGVGRYADAAGDAVTTTFGRWDARVLSLPKLIASKRSTGRPRDALVANELEVVASATRRLARATRTAS
jgi:hypothetical protein